MSRSPASTWLATLDPAALDEILCRRPDAATPPPRDVDELAERLMRPESVAAVLAGLPLPAIQVLETMTLLVPHGADSVTTTALAHRLDRAPDDAELDATLQVLRQRALVWPEGDHLHTAPGLRALLSTSDGPAGAFDPLPPAPALHPIDTVAVSAEASVAALTLLDQIDALVDAAGLDVDGAAVAALPGDPATVRLLERLAAGAGLLDDPIGWRREAPTERLVRVLCAWCPPGSGSTGDDPPTTRRRLVLRALEELPPGIGVLDPETLAPLAHWTAPLPWREVSDPTGEVVALLHEATRVGLCAHGAISPLGRALLASATRLRQVAAHMLAPASTRAMFADDLTVVVAGTPSTALRALLDSCAEPRSRGAAPTWRFTTGSIRRALESGQSPVDLLGRLRDIAGGASLPRSLERLVHAMAGGPAVRPLTIVASGDAGSVSRAPDPASTVDSDLAESAHAAGAAARADSVDSADSADDVVTVRSVGCVVVAVDAAIIEEMLRDRSLHVLSLAALAPTVLSSALPAAQTSTALRAAGYPLAATASMLHRVPSPRAEPEVYQQIRARAKRLTQLEARRLAHAIQHGTPVEIGYTDGEGVRSTRVIELAELHGQRLEAWCRLRGDERAFTLERIDAVAPVDR